MASLEGVRDIFVDNDCMWMISDNLNGLFRYDFLKQKLDLIAMFPEMIGAKCFAFNSILKIQNEIYFFPLTAKNIYCYDLLKKTFYQLNVSFHGTNNARGIVAGEYIYCLNRFPDMLIKIHIATKKAEIYNVGICINEAAEEYVYRSYLAPCLYQGQIIWSSYGNSLTFFDLETRICHTERLEEVLCEKIERTKGYYQGGLDDWIVGGRVYNDILWLLSYDGRIYQYDDKLHKSQCVQTYQREYKNLEQTVPAVFADMIPMGDKLWFVPQYKGKGIKYNSSTNQYVECMDEYEQKLSESQRIEYTLCKALDNEKIIIYSYYDRCFFILDTVKHSADKKIIKIPCGRFAEENESFRSMIIRDNMIGFDNLTFLLKDTRIYSRQRNSLVKPVGGKIYEILK